MDMAGNGHDPILPDEGLSREEVLGLDAVTMRAMVQEAMRQKRWDMQHGAIRSKSGVNGADDDDAGEGAASSFDDLMSGAAGGNGASAQAIRWSASHVRPATIACGAALAALAPRLYTRGKALAVLTLPDPLENIAEERLTERNTRVKVDVNMKRARIATVGDLEWQVQEAGIRFVGSPGGRGNKASGERSVTIHTPAKPLETCLRDPQLCPARRLMAIAGIPHMDRRGVLNAQPGYDRQTGVYLDIDGLAVPEIPEQPEFKDVEAAVEVLMRPFVQFENYTENPERFTGEVLTLLLTGLERPFVERAPMLMVSGGKAGLAKGDLCHSVAVLAYGSKGDIITPGENDEEFAKRIDSVLIDGPPSILVDNLNNHLMASLTLASMATEGYASIRLYGHKGKDVRVEGRPLIMLNGINLVPSRDNNRRVFLVRLTTRVDQPALRDYFRGGMPSEMVRESRGDMLAAAFTIMRWWRRGGLAAAARRGGKAHALGSFEGWEERVARLVEAITGWNPVGSIKENIELDAFSQNNTNALGALARRFGEGNVFTASNVQRICDAVTKSSREGGFYTVPEMALHMPMHPALEQAREIAERVDQALKAVRTDGAKQAAMAGLVNPGTTVGQMEDLDRTVRQMLAWRKREAVEAQQEVDMELDEAMAAVTSGKKNSQQIGLWFRSVEEQVIGGWKLIRIKSAQKNGAEVLILRV
jgi:hypothetical protein